MRWTHKKENMQYYKAGSGRKLSRLVRPDSEVDEFDPASIPKRILAKIVDYILMGMPFYLLLKYVFLVKEEWSFIISYFCMILCISVMESITQASIGKKLFKIKVWHISGLHFPINSFFRPILQTTLFFIVWGAGAFLLAIPFQATWSMITNFGYSDLMTILVWQGMPALSALVVFGSCLGPDKASLSEVILNQRIIVNPMQ